MPSLHRASTDALIRPTFHKFTILRCSNIFLLQVYSKLLVAILLLWSTGGGPYFIMFGADIEAPKYITVCCDEGLQLKGTLDKNEAELFTVKVLDSDSGQLEFSITSSLTVYREKEKQRQADKTAQPSGEAETASGEMGEELDGESGLRVKGTKPQTTEKDKTTVASKKGDAEVKRFLEYYLEVPVNALGKSNMVRMKMNSRLKNVRLLLK